MRLGLGDCFLDEANTIPCPPDTTYPANTIPAGAPGSMTGPYAPITTGNKTVNDAASWLSQNSTMIVAGCAILGLVLSLTGGKR